MYLLLAGNDTVSILMWCSGGMRCGECHLVTHADGSRGVGFSLTFVCQYVCLSVCLFVYLHDLSKNASDRITKLDIEMVQHESWKPIYFVIKHGQW